jgi:hypothetical protein
MMKKFVFFVVWIQCLTLSLLWGQNSMTIHGQIFDETGTPLIGANIYISGTSTGTSTDLNGAFQLEIPADTKSLICSYIGYVPLEIAVYINPKVYHYSIPKVYHFNLISKFI